MLVFSRQNILRDAPFSRMELVSCRNLLIYLQQPAQKRVLRTLHYSLNPGGYLLLGAAENIGDAPDLFDPVDRKSKVYRSRPVATHVPPDLGYGTAAMPELRPETVNGWTEALYPEVAERKATPQTDQRIFRCND
jgi:two-component system CheB/CheR fusion protein